MHDEELGFFEPRPWHQDRPQRPKVWGEETPSNWWGPMSHGSPQQARALAQPTAAPVHHGLQTAPAGARKPALAEARTKQTQKKSRGKTRPRRRYDHVVTRLTSPTACRSEVAPERRIPFWASVAKSAKPLIAQ